MGLIAILSLFFIILSFLGGMIGLSAAIYVWLFSARAVRSSQIAWLATYLIWVPGLPAAYTVCFIVFSIYASSQSWAFPQSLSQFLILLIAGQVFTMIIGFVTAFRLNNANKFPR